jgi:hypothetical protein
MDSNVSNPDRIKNINPINKKYFDANKLDNVYINDEPLRNNTEREIVTVCDDIKNLLIEKNRAYGNSVLEPSNVFAKSSALDQISTRIDDKLNRVKKGHEYQGEDTIDDLIGYLVLYKIALRDNWR